MITLVILLVLGIVIEYLAFRPLRTGSPLAKLAASLGVLLVAQASVSLAFGIGSKPQPPVLPRGLVTIFGTSVPVDRLILPGIVILATLGLSLLYRLSRFGLATRAASENEVGAMLLGFSPNQLALANTLLATVIVGGLGILAASIVQLDSTSLPLQVVPALTAALFAGFRRSGSRRSPGSRSGCSRTSSTTCRPSAGSRPTTASRCPASSRCSCSS